MAKLEPMSRLRSDVREGDIIRLVLTGGQECVGYYRSAGRHLSYLMQDIPSEKSPNEISIDFRQKFRFNCTIVGDGSPTKATGYEILRRAKK